ncbi:PilZ domain-containing protein [Methylomonas sp. HYX-M1]|uniref:PilZ domain-containing protein n=1 Tax=Methylomonas sp. HYX-M1 TaxID=3139307 RepID=UPI00345B9CBA
MSKEPVKTINRRLAYRVYDQAHLIFSKLEQEPEQLPPAVSAYPPIPVLPNSKAKENDTLRVNISSNGVAFTCEQPLYPGDMLRVRIFLLSTQTSIVTCCRVIYCKPSNPFELDRYPYTVGAQFVNLATGDREVLLRYVRRHQRFQWLRRSLLSACLLIVLLFPIDTADYLYSVAEIAIESLIDLALATYESSQFHLYKAIERTLATDSRQTEMLLFYLTLLAGLTLGYLIWRTLPGKLADAFYRLGCYLTRKKSSLAYAWSEQSALDKAKIIAVGLLSVGGYAFLSF